MPIGTDRHHFRRTCWACLHVFTCLSAYQVHLFGRRATARCRTPEKMREIGMKQAADGAWMSRMNPRPKKVTAPSAPRPGHKEPFA